MIQKRHLRMIVKRLFLGFEVDAPRFSNMPQGRMVARESRHLTLAFLGEVDYGGLAKRLEQIPAFSFNVGAAMSILDFFPCTFDFRNLSPRL